MPTGRGPPPCVAASHQASDPAAASENTSIGARQESPRSASGTASAVVMRRADLDAAGVDARDEQRAVGEALLDGDDHERVAEAHADGDRQRQRDHGERARQDRAHDASAGDQREREA